MWNCTVSPELLGCAIFLFNVGFVEVLRSLHLAHQIERVVAGISGHDQLDLQFIVRARVRDESRPRAAVAA